MRRGTSKGKAAWDESTNKTDESASVRRPASLAISSPAALPKLVPGAHATTHENRTYLTQNATECCAIEQRERFFLEVEHVAVDVAQCNRTCFSVNR